MTENEEPLDGTETTDTKFVDGTVEDLYDALKEIGTGRIAAEKAHEKAKVLYTMRYKYDLDWPMISGGLGNVGINILPQSLARTMKDFIDKPKPSKKQPAKSTEKRPAKPVKEKAAMSTEKKALKAAEETINKRISKEIHDTITTDAEIGEWIRRTYGSIADMYNWPTPQLIATAMDYWLFEKDKTEALLEEVLGDDIYMRTEMDDLRNAASPNFIALEKMKLMNQMTELVTLLEAYGYEVPQNLLPAHMRALNEIESEGFYGNPPI